MLLVPDTIFWVTGTIAQSILKYVEEIEGVICSARVVSKIIKRDPEWLEQFDVIHILCPHASKSLLPYFAGKKPVVTTIHHVIDWERMKHNTGGDRVMTLSKEWEEYILNQGVPREKLELVRNGVDTKKFVPVSDEGKGLAKKRAGFEQDVFVIGFFAKRQLSDFDRKGIDTFEKAIGDLVTLEKNVGLLLVGPGWRKLVLSLKKLNISVKWYPYLEPHDKIIHLYNALDCYWVTSRIEGGPVTLLEAMSCGIPCISTPVGLSLELIDEGRTGFMIDKNEPRELVSKTIKLINDKSLADQIGKNARTKISAELDYSNTLNPVNSLYIKAITNFEKSNPLALKSRQPGQPIKFWMKQEERIFWMSILRKLGEYSRAFRFGMNSVFLYPSIPLLKLQVKTMLDLLGATVSNRSEE